MTGDPDQSDDTSSPGASTSGRINQIPQFYVTRPLPCPYLDGLFERKVFTYLKDSNPIALNDFLTQTGFRRSQNIAYSPACDNCKACISLRIPVKTFTPSSSMRRILNRNKYVSQRILPPRARRDHYELFASYINQRHANAGMSDMQWDDYCEMVEESPVNTHLVEYRLLDADERNHQAGPLLGVMLIDIINDGLSLVYSFYDTQQARRSLGTYMILKQIDEARLRKLDYVYLGYYVENSAKMAYKENFRPQQRLIGKNWQLFE